MDALEVGANALMTGSILLAARNSVHTWWTGMVGCVLFAVLFGQAKLYADVTLQVFFVVSSAWGWWHWLRGQGGQAAPIGTLARGEALKALGIALAVTAGYGALLHTLTDAYAPFVDSAVLAFSVVAQVLLVRRRIETWAFWLLVNSVAVPLYASRGLYLTAALYAGYWVNAALAWRAWHRGLKRLNRLKRLEGQSARRGLVVGKFCPLHLGHVRLIEHALAACDDVLIISYTVPEFPQCDVPTRANWLRTLFPNARVLVLDQHVLDQMCRERGMGRGIGRPAVPHNDAADHVHRAFVGWLCWELLQTTVDVVFTSEAYGDGFADALTAYFSARTGATHVRHVCVDIDRIEVPISGTALRAQAQPSRRFLPGVVYASLVRRVAILGGESSGKSTLAQALAASTSSVHAAEYGRERWVDQQGALTVDDMLAIATAQVAREEGLLHQAEGWLFCDTTPLTTLFYSQDLFGQVAPKLFNLAARPYHHVLLCAPDFPFVQDGTRREPAFRERQHQWYCDELSRRGIAYTLLHGPIERRVEEASKALAIAIAIAIAIPGDSGRR